MWTDKFIAIFSSQAAYSDLAARLRGDSSHSKRKLKGPLLQEFRKRYSTDHCLGGQMGHLGLQLSLKLLLLIKIIIKMGKDSGVHAYFNKFVHV